MLNYNIRKVVLSVNKESSETSLVTGIFAFILNIIILTFTTLMFIPILIDIIKYRHSQMELGILIMWLFDFILIIALIIALSLTVISVIKKDYKWRIICNSVFMGLSIILMILSTVLVFSFIQ